MLISRGPMGEALELPEYPEFGGRPVVGHWGPEPIVIEHRLSLGMCLFLAGMAAAFFYFIYEMARRYDMESPVVEGVRE